MTDKRRTSRQAGPDETTPQQRNDSILDEILQHLQQVEREKDGDGYVAICPFHDDHRPSLKIFDNGGFVCRACDEHGNHYRLALHFGIRTKEHTGLLDQHREHLSHRLGTSAESVDKIAARLNIQAKGESLMLPVFSFESEPLFFIDYNRDRDPRYLYPSGAPIQGNLYGLDLALNLGKIHKPDEQDVELLKGSLVLTEGPFDALGCLAHGIPAAAIMGSANAEPQHVCKTLNKAGLYRLILAFDNDTQGKVFARKYLRHLVKNPEIITRVCLQERYKDINETIQKEGPGFFESFFAELYEPLEAFIQLHDIRSKAKQGKQPRHVALMELVQFFCEMHPLHQERADLERIREEFELTSAEWRAYLDEIPQEKNKERVKNGLARLGDLFSRNLQDDPVGAVQNFISESQQITRGLEKRIPLTVVDELEAIISEAEHEQDGLMLHSVEGLNRVVIQPVDLVVLGGPSGHGKTTFALSIANHFMKHHEKRVLFVSYEMNRPRVLARIVAIETGKTHKQALLDIKQRKNVESITSPLYRRLSIVADRKLSVEELTRLVAKYQEENPLGLVIVDYDQLAPTEARLDHEERRVAHISQTLKGITTTHNLPVMLLTQLSKQGDTRWSRQKEFDASIVLKLNTPKEWRTKKADNNQKEAEYKQMNPRPVEVEIVKNREGPSGWGVDVMVDFETLRISNTVRYR